ncbi:MAG TPA: hypothetical protein PLW65_03920 [Pseudomonadota bacterium]|nr:hypothetical protein [Pseudomonadota bacterium]
MNSSTATSQKPSNGVNHQSLDHSAAMIRDKLAKTLKEIDNRLPTMAELKNQMIEHKVAIALTGSAFLLTLASGIAIGIKRSQQRKTFSYKVQHGLDQVQDVLKCKLDQIRELAS